MEVGGHGNDPSAPIVVFYVSVDLLCSAMHSQVQV